MSFIYDEYGGNSSMVSSRELVLTLIVGWSSDLLAGWLLVRLKGPGLFKGNIIDALVRAW